MSQSPHPDQDLRTALDPDHEFKSHPDVFWPAVRGEKMFEFRKDDRGGYSVGQTVRRRCYDPDHGYHGHPPLDRRITNILRGGEFGLQDGYCILSLAALTPSAPIAAPVREDVPAGWRLVPEEPTDAMVQAGGEVLPPTHRLTDCYEYFRAAWSAALASLPTPASDVQGEAQTEAARKERARFRIQALGAALSRRDWSAVERSYEAIRDAHDRPEIYDAPLIVSPGEAQTQEGGR